MTWHRRVGSLAVAGALAVSFTWVNAQQRSGGATVAIDADDIGGVVTSSTGPEAGVWVVAETTDLPTKFARMVVTDDQGRYVLPDLPAANYQVFVRGYGLVDSARVAAKPGQHLDLKAVVAPDGRAAAQVYPANYWLSLMEIPKGDVSDKDVLLETKACYSCHQVGDLVTREISKNLGSYTSSLDAWDHHTAVGPNGPGMSANFKRMGAQRKAYADWTDRIAAGAFPKAPPRPAGLERNVVISMWDWALPTSRRTDVAATDERTPTMNANGLVYGSIQSSDIIAVLDPRENATTQIKLPSNAPQIDTDTAASPFWGDEKIWQRSADPRSVTMDSHGRLFVTARIRAPQDQPAFCKDGSTNKFAKYFALPGPSGRQVEMYDPKTRQITMIDTCFAADHNHFDDKGSIIYGQNNAIGWVDTVAFDKTHDAAASQGWCPAVLDTNGDGKITEWTEPNQPIDPKKDHRINFGCYGVAINPIDGSLWCSGIGVRDKTLMRLERGANPPQSCKAEVYVPPPDKMPLPGSGGVAIDSNGLVWQNWRGAHEMLSFDRRKCKVLNGPDATGQQCPEGWTVYTKPGPTFQGAPDYASTDMLYMTELDRDNTLGLGKDVVLSGDVNADSFFVVMPQGGQTLTLRVPYPLGFAARAGSGRIDDPNAGWKGRGFWSSYSMYTPWHQEGGKGARPKIVKFQVRPTPLAK
jgi:carboxypeptidase family protein